MTLLVGDDLGSDFRRLCSVEWDRRRTSKLIQPRPGGRSRGRTNFPSRLSGQIGLTNFDDGKTHAAGSFTGRREIQDCKRSMISSGTPTIRSLFGVFGGP